MWNIVFIMTFWVAQSRDAWDESLVFWYAKGHILLSIVMTSVMCVHFKHARGRYFMSILMPSAICVHLSQLVLDHGVM
jgi:hypothetical protein